MQIKKYINKKSIKHHLLEQLLLEQLLEQPMLEQQLLEQLLLEQPMLEQLLLEQPMLEQQLLEHSYNHFKSLKRAFNSNICKSTNIISFGRVAMLECFKSASNKIFMLNICKNKIILKIIIIKIILLIRNNDIIIPDKFTKD